MATGIDSIVAHVTLAQEPTFAGLLMERHEHRYFLVEEPDGSLSICDRNIVEAERDHRVVTGLGQDQAAELLKKLNAKLDDAVK